MHVVQPGGLVGGAGLTPRVSTPGPQSNNDDSRGLSKTLLVEEARTFNRCHCYLVLLYSVDNEKLLRKLQNVMKHTMLVRNTKI